MKLLTVSSSAARRADSVSRSAFKAPIVREAQYALPAPARTTRSAAAAASGEIQRRRHLAVQRPSRHRRLVGAGRGVDVLPRRARLLPPLGLAPPAPAPPQRIQRAVASNGENPRHERAASCIVPVDMAPHLREHI